MLLYRLPEALLLKICPLFLLDKQSAGGLGLSTSELGFVQGTIGVIGLTIGGILGGVLAAKGGLKRWLWPMVLVMSFPNIAYVYLSMAAHPSFLMINACVFFEQFGYGLGFTVLTLYMLYYSQGKFRTSHYSICTGISYLGLMLPGMVSGYVKDIMGYKMFFIFVMACCLITFLVTAFLKIAPEFGKKK
jgi:PAT family beta-lactamase induction signal transducer AmpG